MCSPPSRFDYHKELHYSQTRGFAKGGFQEFDYHKELHYSQTVRRCFHRPTGLTTIKNYTTLKLMMDRKFCKNSLTTIKNYTTLKRVEFRKLCRKGLTTIKNYTTLKPTNPTNIDMQRV